VRLEPVAILTLALLSASATAREMFEALQATLLFLDSQMKR
jgi:hypothetical protein